MGQINDELYKDLVESGYEGHINDMLYKWLGDNSYAGSTLPERMFSYGGLAKIIRDVLAGEFGFNPLQLFSQGEQGAWYDPSDLSTLFQDAAGTVPVTADGDPVGLMMDKSPNGNHAIQSVAASRPTYRTDGTLHWLEADGIDDHMLVSGSALDSTTDQMYVIGMTMEAIGNFPAIFGGSNTNGFSLIYNGTTRQRRPFMSTTAGDSIGNASVATPLSTAVVRRVIWDRSVGTATDLENAANDITTTPARLADLDEPANYELLRWAGDNARCINAKMYGLVIVSKTAMATEIEKTEEYLAGKSGVNL